MMFVDGCIWEAVVWWSGVRTWYMQNKVSLRYRYSLSLSIVRNQKQTDCNRTISTCDTLLVGGECRQVTVRLNLLFKEIVHECDTMSWIRHCIVLDIRLVPSLLDYLWFTSSSLSWSTTESCSIISIKTLIFNSKPRYLLAGCCRDVGSSRIHWNKCSIYAVSPFGASTLISKVT